MRKPPYRILVVDDAPANREAVAEMLRAGGYCVEEACDGQEGLAGAGRFDPHLFVLDVAMPGMSGIELLGRLKVERSQSEAIMMTGFENVDDARKAIELGARSYLAKPIQSRELFDHVERALHAVEKREHEQQYRTELEQKVRDRTMELASSLRTVRDQSRQLDMVLNGMREGLIAFDTQGTVLKINPAAEFLTGVSEDHAVGRRAETILPGAFMKTVRLIMNRNTEQKQGGEGSRDHVHLLNRFLSISVTAMRDESGRGLGHIVIIGDETDKVQNQRLRAGFLGIVAHEFRTPLQVILSNLSMVQSGETAPETLCEIARDAMSASRRLSALVDTVMRIAALVRPQISVNLSGVDLRGMIREQAGTVLKRYPEKKVRIRETGGDGSIAAFTDPVLLGDAVGILIDNAVKFSSDGSEVMVGARSRGMQCDISVSDRAGGIPPEKRESIFNWFEQAEESLTRRHGGIGLGLPLARQAIELLGGSIALETVPGTGSTFIATIPSHAPDPDMHSQTEKGVYDHDGTEGPDYR